MTKNGMIKKALFCLLGAACTVNGFGGVFTSSDGRFTMDMPAGWTKIKNPPKNSVLSLTKDKARIDIKTMSGCTTETCLERQTAADLADVKSKKMNVVGNAYTGEEIKRIDFSTGEPFFYISFYTPKNDFSAGYFLVDGAPYSILAKDVSYAQADLLFSFISPLVPAQAGPAEMQMDVSSSRAYDITSAPQVQEEILDAPAPAAEQLAPAKPAAAPAARTAKKALFTRLKRFKHATLVTKNMPPYIRSLGCGFDILVALAVLFALLQAGALVIRFFVRPRKNEGPVNPNSPFPIRFRRLYGTPSLIFRAKDNRGNVLISLSSRWDSLFMFTGAVIVLASLLVLAGTGLMETCRVTALSAFAYNTIYSACSLLIPLGVLVFLCGAVWSLLILREITLFDKKGKKAVIVLQKGFGLTKERYEVYFAASKDIRILERKRFSYYRQWQITDKERRGLARIYEARKAAALLRKLTGHLWGMLRADYVIEGRMDSRGEIRSAATAFDAFTCNMDKPQAVDARDLLVAALLINIRDRDKWYPWFN